MWKKMRKVVHLTDGEVDFFEDIYKTKRWVYGEVSKKKNQSVSEHFESFLTTKILQEEDVRFIFLKKVFYFC